MTTVEARDLTLRYGKVTAVDQLSMRLDGVKIYGLLGRNGSGKTSLLSVIGGLRKASAGEARVDGEPVFENPGITHEICLIRETGDTVDDDWPADRVKDALEFAAELRPRWDSEYAASLVERFRLPLNKRLKSLSRGQRSALASILGLASRAPLTMFDESYIGMDAPSRYAFYDELLADYLAHPRAIIVSTHLIEEISSVLEEVVIINDGRLVAHENVDDLRSRGTAVIGPRAEVDRFTEGLAVLGAKQLGPTKSAMVFGQLDESRRSGAAAAGLELGPLALQELFVHLTETPGGRQ